LPLASVSRLVEISRLGDEPEVISIEAEGLVLFEPAFECARGLVANDDHRVLIVS